MTEADWNSCNDPTPMLAFLYTSGRVTERKLRLFAVACCRRVWPLLDDGRSRRAVEVAERYADGSASTQGLKEAHKSAWEACQMPARTAASDASRVDEGVAFRPDDAASHAAWATPGRTRAGERQAQAELLRCLFGPLPFRTITIEPDILRWHDGIIAKLAQTIYDERRFEGMPVLADALEESGYNDADMLAHCRQQRGVHARGCWVIDHILAKG